MRESNVLEIFDDEGLVDELRSVIEAVGGASSGEDAVGLSGTGEVVLHVAMGGGTADSGPVLFAESASQHPPSADGRVDIFETSRALLTL